jgi:hypothetical protein
MAGQGRARVLPAGGLDQTLACPSKPGITENEATHFDKGIDSKNDELGLGARVVHEVEVDELLLLQIIRLLRQPKRQAHATLAAVVPFLVFSTLHRHSTARKR